MAALVHFVKQDFGIQTTTETSPVEETNYTVSWSDLTGAGFANGDVVGIIVIAKIGSSSTSGLVRLKVGKGSTYAGASDFLSSGFNVENASTDTGTGHQYIFVDQVTLATDDNIYTSHWSQSTYTARVDDFTIFIFKTADLGSANYKFATIDVGADAPTTPTDGASVTLPAGDWLIFAHSYWQGDDVTADYNFTILVGGSEVQRVVIEGEDTSESINLGAMVYAPGLSANTIAKVQYWTDEASTQDITTTQIIAIRLDAFKDHWGVHSTSTITHSVLDTYSEVCGNGSYTPTITGPVLAFCYPHHTYGQASHAPYGRIQVGGADWPSAGVGRPSIIVNGPASAEQGPMLAGYGSLNASTAYDFDFDCAEDFDISPTYDCDQQDAVIFSLELLGASSSSSSSKSSSSSSSKSSSSSSSKSSSSSSSSRSSSSSSSSQSSSSSSSSKSSSSSSSSRSSSSSSSSKSSSSSSSSKSSSSSSSSKSSSSSSSISSSSSSSSTSSSSSSSSRSSSSSSSSKSSSSSSSSKSSSSSSSSRSSSSSSSSQSSSSSSSSRSSSSSSSSQSSSSSSSRSSSSSSSSKSSSSSSSSKSSSSSSSSRSSSSSSSSKSSSSSSSRSSSSSSSSRSSSSSSSSKSSSSSSSSKSSSSSSSSKSSSSSSSSKSSSSSSSSKSSSSSSSSRSSSSSSSRSSSSSSSKSSSSSSSSKSSSSSSSSRSSSSSSSSKSSSSSSSSKSSSSSSSSKSSSSSSSSKSSSSSSSSKSSSSSSSKSSSSSSSSKSSSSSSSRSSSFSSSSSSSATQVGTWCWGHDTDVEEDYIGNLADGAGTGEVTGVGDNEILTLEGGENWVLPAVEIGAVGVLIEINHYQEGTGIPLVEYRTGATKNDCENAEFAEYDGVFDSLGWIQIKLSN